VEEAHKSLRRRIEEGSIEGDTPPSLPPNPYQKNFFSNLYDVVFPSKAFHPFKLVKKEDQEKEEKEKIEFRSTDEKKKEK